MRKKSVTETTSAETTDLDVCASPVHKVSGKETGNRFNH